MVLGRRVGRPRTEATLVVIRITNRSGAQHRGEQVADGVGDDPSQLGGHRLADPRLQVGEGDRGRPEPRTVTTKRHTLLGRGPVPTVTVVAARIEEATTTLAIREMAEKVDAEKADTGVKEAKAAEQLRRTAEKELQTVQRELKEVEQRHLRAETTTRTLAASLRGEWTTRWEGLSSSDVAALRVECDGLRASGVSDEFRWLQEDNARRDEWDRQRHRHARRHRCDPRRRPHPSRGRDTGRGRRWPQDCGCRHRPRRRRAGHWAISGVGSTSAPSWSRTRKRLRTMSGSTPRSTASSGRTGFSATWCDGRATDRAVRQRDRADTSPDDDL